MSRKIILLIAFILTGVGVLLFLLSQKKQTKKSNNPNSRYTNRQTPPTTYTREKSILILVINADLDRDLINSLRNSTHLEPEDSRKLYDATKYLWIGSESEFARSIIKQGFTNNYLVDTPSEYDVYFVKIELDKLDLKFEPNINQMDRRDAFRNLADQSPKITVSPRLSSEAYGNSEFYSR